MNDAILMILGGLIVAVGYLIFTVQRQERALQYFQEELQRQPTQIASWDSLTGGED